MGLSTALGLVLLGAWMAGVWPGRSVPEPVIRGRPAGQYFPLWQRPGPRSVVRLTLEEQSELLTNHLAWVVAEIDREPEPFHALMLSHRDRLPKSVQGRLPIPMPADLRRGELMSMLYFAVLTRGVDPVRVLSLGKPVGWRVSVAMLWSLRTADQGAVRRFGLVPERHPVQVIRPLLRHKDARVRVAAAVTLLGWARGFRDEDLDAAAKEAVRVVRRAASAREGLASDWRELARLRWGMVDSGREVEKALVEAAEFVDSDSSGVIAFQLWRQRGVPARLEALLEQLVQRRDPLRLASALREGASARPDELPALMSADPGKVASGLAMVLASPLASTPAMQEAVGTIPAAKSEIPGLTNLIRQRQDEVTGRETGVSAALRLMAGCGTNGAPEAGVLARYLEDPAGFVRLRAAEALGAMGGAAEVNADAAVRKGLSDPEMRLALLEWLAARGPVSGAMLTEVLPLMRDEDRVLRLAAYRAALRIAPGDLRVWPELKRALRDPAVQAEVVRGLSAFPGRVGEVRAELEAVVSDESAARGMDEIRREARKLLE